MRFDSLRKETDLWLYEEDGAHWNSINAGINILSGWTHGLALQINIHRHFILPSVKRQRVRRVMWIKDDRVVEIKGETFLKTSGFQLRQAW